jgi:glutamine amidotransferase
VIGVIDYGVTNLGSMLNMLRRVGAKAEGVTTPEQLMRATKLILPGIGHFDNGVAALAERGFVDALKSRVGGDGIPMLGVCLGMQLLGIGSEEGSAAGLGLINAFSRRFELPPESGLRVPHMGWNVLTPRRADGVLGELAPNARFYFVHSYHVVCEDPDDVLATADYGSPFTAALHRGNVWGVQFHPEKSHKFGMRLLANFAAV